MEIGNMFQEIASKEYRGHYLIWVEEEDDGTISLYSTDSLFWKNFFNVE